MEYEIKNLGLEAYGSKLQCIEVLEGRYQYVPKCDAIYEKFINIHTDTGSVTIYAKDSWSYNSTAYVELAGDILFNLEGSILKSIEYVDCWLRIITNKGIITYRVAHDDYYTPFETCESVFSKIEILEETKKEEIVDGVPVVKYIKKFHPEGYSEKLGVSKEPLIINDVKVVDSGDVTHSNCSNSKGGPIILEEFKCFYKRVLRTKPLHTYWEESTTAYVYFDIYGKPEEEVEETKAKYLKWLEGRSDDELESSNIYYSDFIRSI